MRPMCAALLLVAFAVIGPAPASPETIPVNVQRHDCPEEPGDHVAPTGRLVVACQPAEESSGRHALVLKTADGRSIGIVREFERHVRFEWSPDGRALALTDYVASNQSVCSIVVVTAGIQETDLTEMITPSKKQWRGHWFCEMVQWRGPNRVLIKAWGHGGERPESFEQHYEYELGKEIVKARP
jgi:hypothetical protein